MSTQAVVPEVEQPKAKTNILDKATVLILTRRWPPQTKTVSNPILNSNANSQMIAVSKKLWNSEELKDIINEEAKLDAFLKTKASPFPFKRGWHLLAIDLYGEVEDYFVGHMAKREELIGKFITCYQKAKDESKQLLGDQYNENDYPPVEVVRSYFMLRREYMQFSVDAKLSQLDQEAAQRQDAQFQATITEAGQAASSLLAEQMQDILGHLAERLTPKVDEDTGELKRKTFRSKMLTPIEEFLINFDPRNLGEHEGLRSLATKVKGMMDGVTVDSLKSNDEQRTKLEQQIKEAKAEIDQIVTDMPMRAIQFFEE